MEVHASGTTLCDHRCVVPHGVTSHALQFATLKKEVTEEEMAEGAKAMADEYASGER